MSRGQFYSLSFLSTLIFTSLNAAAPTFEFGNFLKKMLESDELRRCSVQLFTYTEEHTSSTENSIFDNLSLFTTSLLNSFETSGIVISEIKTGLMDCKKYKKPAKISHAKRCSVVIITVNTLVFSLTLEKELKEAVVSPLLYPPTTRNQDKYLILISQKHDTFKLQKSKFFKGLKYKLVLMIADYSMTNCPLICTKFHLTVFIKRACQYGSCRQLPKFLTDVDFHLLSSSKYSDSIIQSIFPDHERNFFGHTLRLSTTTKVPQLLEFDFIKNEYGKVILKPKRGLYASVLYVLSNRLNFTYEIVPSSGSGSTGHPLPNGTWVGTVGDTFKGIVDFGFMAAVTYQRFPYAEFCAPINFAYLGFVTGPPRKTYAWNAILWPFDPVMWTAVGLACLVSAKLVTLISQSLSLTNGNQFVALGQKSTKWTYLRGVSFLVRGLLGQCSDLPSNMNHVSFRTFLTFWLLFCLVCTTAYSSKMVSLLTFPTYDPIPATFDELAVSKDFAIDFHYFGNVGYAYFKTSTNPSFITIYQRMGREPSPLKCLQRTINEKAACIIFIITFAELLHRNLSDQYGKSPLKFTPDTSRVFPAGVIHEYKAPLSSNFQSVLFPAMEAGLIPRWEKTDLNQVLDNKNRWQKANNIDATTAVWGHDVTDNLLRVRNLKGAFIILALGTTAALLAYIVEKRTLNINHIVKCDYFQRE